MKKIGRKLKRTNWLVRYFYYLVFICLVVSYILFTKSLLNLKGIETFLRYIIIGFFFLWILFYGFYDLLKLIKKKYKSVIIMSLISTLFIGLFLVTTYYIDVIYEGLGNIKDNSVDVYTSYLIKLKDTEFNEKSVIGRISKDDDEEGYNLTTNIIKEHNLKNKINEYDDYFDLAYSLYNKSLDAIFVPGNYISLYSGSENLENISSETEIVYQYQVNAKEKEPDIISNKDFNDPLTFLLLGVDSTKNGLKNSDSFNGDTLMFISFNPATLETLMVSIPRDTYVPITCNNNKYAKINSSAAYGTNCVIETVSELLDTNIDYYVKINFKGVVDLVDALGGVEVEVEKPTYGASKYDGKMCEQNSDREFGSKLVCISPGKQTLNGEQTLAYSRNRHLYLEGDLDRIRHQQQVVEAIAKKLLNFSTLTDFKKIFNALSNNLATNMSTDKILSGYSVVKDMALNALNGEEFINITKATLETYNLRVYLPNSKTYTSAQAYYVDSLEDIRNAIKTVLGEKKAPVVKTFSFSVNEEYKGYVAGQGKREKQSLALMPNLIGSSVTKAEEFCETNNITLNKEYVSPGDAHYNASVQAGLIADQDVIIGTLLNNVSELTIYIANAKADASKTDETDENNNQDSNKEKDEELEDEIKDNFNLF